MIGTEVLAKVEEKNVSAQVVALTSETTSDAASRLRIIEYREVRPLRIENYPALAKVWDDTEDDDIFADQPGV